MAYELAQAYVQIIPSTKNLTSNLTAAFDDAGDKAGQSAGNKAGSGLLSGLGKAASGAAKVTAAAVTAASGVAAAFTASAVKVGEEFDSSMSQVAATLGYTTEEIENNVTRDGVAIGDTFNALREKAKEMGAATNFSASEAAEGLNILAMSGFDATTSMDMLEDVLHLSAAGSMDMASAAGYISGAIKGFNDETKTSTYYADLMAKGATLANTSVEQLGQALAGGAATASAYNQSADSVTVSLLRLAEQGVTGSAASTALAAAMKNLYTPTSQAAGALEELGVAAYDSEGNARDFNDVVNELDAALSDYSDEQANAYKQTIFGIQGLDAFNKMTVTGTEKQDEWTEALAKASDGAGEAAKQYDTMTDNLQGDIDIWNSALDGFKIAIADGVMPQVREFVQFGSDSLSKITEAFESSGIDGVVDVFGDILTEGIAKITEKLPRLFEIGGKILKTIADAVIANLPQTITAAGEILTSLYQGLADNMPMIMDTALDIILMIGQGFVTYLPDLLQAGIDILVGLVQGITEALPELVPIVIDIIMAITQALVDNIDLVVQAGVDLFLALVQNLPEIIAGLAEAALQIVDAILAEVMTLGDELGEIFSAAWDAIKEVWSIVVEFFSKIWDSIKEHFTPVTDWFKNLFTNAWNAIKNAFSAMTSWFSNIWTSIKNIFSSVGSWFSNIFQNAWTGIKNAFSSVGSFFTGIWNGIKSAFSSVTSWFKDTFSKAWQAVKNVFSTGGKVFEGIKEGIANVFKNVVNAIIRGINKVISIPFNAINNVLNKLRNISVLGVSPFGWISTFSVPQIPELAKGAVLERGQVGLLEGNGAEAVVPLENNRRWIHNVALDMEAEFSRGTSGQMDELIETVEELSAKMDRLKVVLNTGALVGGIQAEMNQALGTSGSYAMRGVATA